MRRDVIRQYEYGRLALPHEIARHGEDEVGVRAEHPGHELLDSLCRDVRPALDQLRTPARHAGVVHDVGHLGRESDGLRRHRRANPPVMRAVYMTGGAPGRTPTGGAAPAATTRSGARLIRFQMNGPPMQKP